MTRDELIKKIEKTSPSNDKEFQEIIAVVVDNGFFTELEVARVMGCSRPTVARWKSGANSPHPLIRPPMFRELIKALQKAT